MSKLRQRIDTLDKQLTALEEFTKDEQVNLANLVGSMQVITACMVSGFICGYLFSYRKSLSQLVSRSVVVGSKIYSNVEMLRKLNIL